MYRLGEDYSGQRTQVYCCCLTMVDDRERGGKGEGCTVTCTRFLDW